MKHNRSAPRARTLMTLGLSLLLGLLAGCANTAIKTLEDPSTRSRGTVVDDQTTETALRRMIIAEGDKRPLRVKVKVFNRYVLLVGEVENLAIAQSFEVKAARFLGVRRVFNRLIVENPLPSYKGFDDLLLNARVTLALSGTKELNDARIERIVDRNRVYLMGLTTEEQADLAVERLSRVNGVKEIITLFEYL